MAISESQLEIWSHRGSVQQSSATYDAIKRALEANDTKYADKSFKVFLQGSYGNLTNIYAESDVDIVICLNSTFFFDISVLTATEQATFNAWLSNNKATYPYADFKAHVLSGLEKSFGGDVKPGKKAIKIKAAGNRRSSDVVVAAEFRRYRSLSTYDLGICFFPDTWDRIANYPRQHSENCTTKHQATNSLFKPMVRILKNMRSRLVNDGLIDDGIAPSYFLEGLLYNVPNDKFGGSYEDTMVAAVNWIQNADRSKFVCANEQYYLLGDSSAVQWPTANCDRFFAELIQFWKNWS